MKAAVFGIDVGATNTVIGLVDKEGRIVSQKSIKTDKHQDITLYIEELLSVFKRLEAEYPKYSLKGIGMGAPNANYYKGTIEHAANLLWKGIIPISTLIHEKSSLPIAITNDANAAALGEQLFGGAQGVDDFIEITLGTGLGSGVVINGKLLYGSTGFAGELGHLNLIRNGRVCGCGKKGCVETYVSATGICRTFLELLATETLPSSLRSLGSSEITSKKIYEAAQEGDTLAQKAFALTARYLGEMLADYVSFTSPKAIFLFGGLLNAGEFFLTPVREAFEESCMQVFKGTVSVQSSHLDAASAAILGASALIWKELEK